MKILLRVLILLLVFAAQAIAQEQVFQIPPAGTPGSLFPPVLVIPSSAVGGDGSMTAGTTLTWAGRSKISSPADGQLLFTNNAGNDFSVIQLGGTSSSFPALQRSGTSVRAVLADLSALTTFTALNLTITTNGTFQMATTYAMNTAPSAPSSCGTSPAVTNSNGTVVMTITGGTGGAATGCVVTMPLASNGWTCYVQNRTADAANRADRKMVQTADTTTSVTFQYQTVSTGAATAFTASDVFKAICMGF